MKKIACVIPARLRSTRFPKKMLAPLLGKPLLQWVWEAACRVAYFDTVTFAIDSSETAAAIEKFGGRYEMTSPDLSSGTDRLVALLSEGKLDADIWVNWQGDEPFINQEMIENLLQSIHDPECDVWTLKKKIINSEEIASPHFAKVVCDAKENALYFSRTPIPFYRDPLAEDDKEYFKHVGIYAFTRESLQKIGAFAPCPLEKAEQLEQLRFLYQGLKIRVHETAHEVIGIDLPEHMTLAMKHITSSSVYKIPNEVF